MANALQMYLMSGASVALVSERSIVGNDIDLAVDSPAFADALSEFKQGDALSERQKAAIHAAMHAAGEGEDAPDADALEAILVDDDSSSKEKDSARAWLAIIQQGKEASTELSSADKQAIPAASAALVLTARDGTEKQISTDDPDKLKHGSEASMSNLKATATQSISVSASKNAPSAELSAENLAEPEESEKNADDKSLVSEKGKVQDGKLNISQQASAHTDPKLASTNTSSAAEYSETDDAEVTDVKLSDKLAATNKSAGAPKQNNAVTSAGAAVDGVPLEQIVRQTNSPDADAKPEQSASSSDTKTADSQNGDTQMQSLASMSDAELMQDAEHEGLILEPRLQPLARSESNSAQQSLAGAAQARAEQVQNSMGSAGQGSSEEKGQRQSSSANQEQWVQGQTEAGKNNEAELNQDMKRSFMAAEQQARAMAASGVAPNQSPEQMVSPTNSNGATTQFIQAQGTASQPQSISAQISEMLRQPMNLLAADATGQLRERLVMMARHSIHHAEIKLEPAELGGMTIRVNMQQDQATVQFLVQQAHAKEILEQQLPRLRDMLQEQGIQLADGQVEQQGSQQSSEQGQGQGQGQQASDHEDADMSSQTILTRTNPERLVDYYA